MELASESHEPQALMSYFQNSMRDTAIGKRWICLDSERSTLHRVWAITEESAVVMECGMVSFFPAGGVHMRLSGNHPLRLLTVSWNCPGTSVCVI